MTPEEMLTQYARLAGALRGSLSSLIYSTQVLELLDYNDSKCQAFRGIIQEILDENKRPQQ